MAEVAERTVTHEGIAFTLQENGRDILIHVPSGKQEFMISPDLWRTVLPQMGLRVEDYFGA